MVLCLQETFDLVISGVAKCSRQVQDLLISAHLGGSLVLTVCP